MGLMLSALVSLIIGLTEKLLPTFVAMWRDKKLADAKLAADAKLQDEENRISKAVEDAQK
jgi:hypothetical protein